MIPYKIYQTWKTKNVKPDMRKAMDTIKSMNPEYEYELYADDDCRQFLLNVYGQRYLDAFDNLVPGAFKGDFWRYAVLYHYGGVYMDADFVALVPLREILKPEDTLVSVKDRTLAGPNCVFQAFIACEKNHPALMYALEISLYNIENGGNISLLNLNLINPTNVLSHTGPIVFGRAINIFLGRDENSYLQTGEIEKGIRLFKHDDFKEIVTDPETNRTLFLAKFDGYDPPGYYGFHKPWLKQHGNSWYFKLYFFPIILLCIIILILILIYNKVAKANSYAI